MSCELDVVRGRPCDLPGCAESTNPSLSCPAALLLMTQVVHPPTDGPVDLGIGRPSLGPRRDNGQREDDEPDREAAPWLVWGR